MEDPKGILGVDYVTLTGRGNNRDTYNGATVEGDDNIHLGILTNRETACKKPFKEFFATYSDVDINCKDCIEALRAGI